MRIKLCVLIVLIFAVTNPVSAITFTWSSPIGGPFNTMTYWSPPGVPGPLDIAQFNQPTAYDIVFSSDVANDELRIIDGIVSFLLPATATYSITNPTYIGYTGGPAGSLILTNGGTLYSLDHGYIGMTGCIGSMTVDNGTWTCDQVIHIGWQNDGELIVNADGIVDANNLYASESAGITGTLDVDGGTLDVSDFQLGVSGTGSGTISGGGQLTTETAVLGVNAGAVGAIRVTGSGSSWTNTGDITINSGSLAVDTSGSVSNGGELSLNGLLLITSSGSLTASQAVFAGSAGTEAIVYITDGSFTVDNNIEIGGNGSATGGTVDFNLESGTMQAGGTLRLWGEDSFLDFSGGTLIAGQLVTEDTSTVFWDAGSLQINGAGGLLLGHAGPDFHPSVNLSPDKELIVLHTLTIDSGIANSLELSGGFYYFGEILLNGGLITGSAGLNLFNTLNGLTGHGEVSCCVSGTASKTITADGLLEMGDSTSTAGFDIDGTLIVGSHSVVLYDSNRAGLGISTQLGTGGELTAANGLRMEGGDVLNATGAATVTGEMYTDGVINGPAVPGEYLVLDGDVLGTGAFSGNIEFHQGYNPASSPVQILFDGNLRLTETASVTMELNGTSPGSGHDQLGITGEFVQDGTLVVQLISEYTPLLGDSYTLFDCGSISGLFDTFDLPVLDPGLAWDTSDVDSTGEIRVILAPTPTPTPASTATPLPVPATGPRGIGLLLLGMAVLMGLGVRRHGTRR